MGPSPPRCYNGGMLMRLAGVLIGCAWLTMPAMGHAAPAALQAPATRLRVYLDCDCFQDFLRTEIQWVDFVRDPKDADVQVLSSRNETGGGGRETVLRFVGLGRFAGQEQELRVLTIAADTEDTERRKVLDVVRVALLSLAAKDGLPADLTLSVGTARAARTAPPTVDRWNLWAFRVGANGSYESEESSWQKQLNVSASADRVTDEWKIGLGARLEEEREAFDLDEDEPLEVVRREQRVDWFMAKSLGEHWSIGLDGDTSSSTFENVKFSAEMAPAIEYNLFPYSQYASRQLRIAYAAGVEHAKYYEVTLFGKLKETHGRHEFSVTLDQREPWGTLQARVEWSQYLHDLSKSRLEVEGEFSFRLARGFSVEFEANVSRMRDQLSLPRRDATPEEVLLRVRQLLSGHEIQLSFGGSYSFGSIFNNIVNPRFGR